MHLKDATMIQLKPLCFLPIEKNYYFHLKNKKRNKYNK